MRNSLIAEMREALRQTTGFIDNTNELSDVFCSESNKTFDIQCIEHKFDELESTDEFNKNIFEDVIKKENISENCGNALQRKLTFDEIEYSFRKLAAAQFSLANTRLHLASRLAGHDATTTPLIHLPETFVFDDINVKDKYPSFAMTVEEYITLFEQLPLTCFRETISIMDKEVIPKLKQDSKDLVRDLINICGQRLTGAHGYQAVYETLAAEILPATLRTKYLENSTNSLEDINMFRQAEIKALVVLHLVNRTLAGGHCFERVLEVFGNLIQILPNSKNALPLDIVLIKENSTDCIAILRSHTNFSLYPPGIDPHSSNDQLCIGEVDAHFIMDLDISKVLTTSVINHIATVIENEISRLLASQEPTFLSNRLEKWLKDLPSTLGEGSTNDLSNEPHEVFYNIFLKARKL